MDDLDELCNIDLNILQSTQSSEDVLHLFTQDLEFIDKAIDNLNNPSECNSYISNHSNDDDSLKSYSEHTGSGFKLASGKRVKTDAEKLRIAKNFLGLSDFSISSESNSTGTDLLADYALISAIKTPSNCNKSYENDSMEYDYRNKRQYVGNADNFTGFNSFATAKSLANPLYNVNVSNEKCYNDSDSKFKLNWLKYSECINERLTLDRLLHHWRRYNPFTVRFDNIYDYKFIINLENCYHIGGISDFRESFKMISNSINKPDLTKWVTNQFKFLAFNECKRYRKKIRELMESKNSTLIDSITSVELPNPYRILRKLYKRYEWENSGSRSIFKLLLEGDESKNQSLVVEVLDIVNDVIYISDGIYCIKAKADDVWVIKLIENKLIFPGIKIVLDDFIRSSDQTPIIDTSPHLLANDEYISLKYNLIRKANQKVKIGRCPKFPRNIYDIKIGGGNISLIDVVVLKGLPRRYALVDKKGNSINYTYEELEYKLQTGQINLEDSEVISNTQYIVIDYLFYSSLNKPISDLNEFTNKLHNSIAFLSFKNISDHIDEEFRKRHTRLRLTLVSHGTRCKTYQIEHLKHINSKSVGIYDFLKCRFKFSQTGPLVLYFNTRSRLEMLELKNNIFSLVDTFIDFPSTVYTCIFGIPVLSFTMYTIEYNKSYPTENHINDIFQTLNDVGIFSSILSNQPKQTDSYCIDIIHGLGAGQTCCILGIPFYITELDTSTCGDKGQLLYIRAFIQTFTLDIISIKISAYSTAIQYEETKKQMFRLKQKIDRRMPMNNHGSTTKWILIENIKFTGYDEANRIFQFEIHLDKIGIKTSVGKIIRVEQEYLNIIWDNLQCKFERSDINLKQIISNKYIKGFINNMLRVGHICCADAQYIDSCMECLSLLKT